MPQMVLDVTPELQERVNFWSGETRQSPNILVLHAIEGYLDDLEDLDEKEPPLNDDEREGLLVAERELAEGKGISFSEVMRELW